MVTSLSAGQPQGEVMPNSGDFSETPILDHWHVRDPLNLLVLSEGCPLANEIVIEGTWTTSSDAPYAAGETLLPKRMEMKIESHPYVNSALVID